MSDRQEDAREAITRLIEERNVILAALPEQQIRMIEAGRIADGLRREVTGRLQRLDVIEHEISAWSKHLSA